MTIFIGGYLGNSIRYDDENRLNMDKDPMEEVNGNNDLDNNELNTLDEENEVDQRDDVKPLNKNEETAQSEEKAWEMFQRNGKDINPIAEVDKFDKTAKANDLQKLVEQLEKVLSKSKLSQDEYNEVLKALEEKTRKESKVKKLLQMDINRNNNDKADDIENKSVDFSVQTNGDDGTKLTENGVQNTAEQAIENPVDKSKITRARDDTDSNQDMVSLEDWIEILDKGKELDEVENGKAADKGTDLIYESDMSAKKSSLIDSLFGSFFAEIDNLDPNTKTLDNKNSRLNTNDSGWYWFEILNPFALPDENTPNNETNMEIEDLLNNTNNTGIKWFDIELILLELDDKFQNVWNGTQSDALKDVDKAFDEFMEEVAKLEKEEAEMLETLYQDEKELADFYSLLSTLRSLHQVPLTDTLDLPDDLYFDNYKIAVRDVLLLNQRETGLNETRNKRDGKVSKNNDVKISDDNGKVSEDSDGKVPEDNGKVSEDSGKVSEEADDKGIVKREIQLRNSHISTGGNKMKDPDMVSVTKGIFNHIDLSIEIFVIHTSCRILELRIF
ncbi:hypothetical protein M8J76_003303 [Diaphorina citri]|nr:hypothetical protein M8J76_003303 [Diaphorina citri]